MSEWQPTAPGENWKPRRRRMPKRHPADVTADRLTEHYEKS